jgi:biopolymer transport protein ExbD
MNGSFSLQRSLLRGGLFQPHTRQEEHSFDITAMVDLVFMLNIYFLVTFVGMALGEVNLPAADHAAALDAEIATTITVLAGRDWNTAVVHLGDIETSPAIHDPDDQATKIEAAVEAGAAQGRTAVLIKAEKNVRLREMNRIAAAAAREGVTLHIAVLEKDTAQ